MISVEVAAVVPLPQEFGGAGEILAIAAFGSARLPAGELPPGASLFAAARRVVWQSTGAGATAERLVYIVERAGRSLTFCVLCALDDTDEAPEPRAGVRFISPAAVDEFDPPPLRDLLIEDAQQGFARPVAHVAMLPLENGGERVEIRW